MLSMDVFCFMMFAERKNRPRGCLTGSELAEVWSERADSEELLTVIMVTCKQAEWMETETPGIKDQVSAPQMGRVPCFSVFKCIGGKAIFYLGVLCGRCG